MRLVVDIQGFKRENNQFIVKEFACYDGKRFGHYVFKSPFPFEMLPPDLQRQATWLMKNHHRLRWNDGFTPLHKFGSILEYYTRAADMVYIKGHEKFMFIKKFCSVPLCELDEQPSLKMTSPKCFYHNNNIGVCALSNVFNLYEAFIMQ